MKSVKYNQGESGISLTIPIPQYRYVDKFLRLKSAAPLLELFTLTKKSTKEISESYSAFYHLGKSLQKYPEALVLHIGDGAHCRTAALFSFLTKTMNITIDPFIIEEKVYDWAEKHKVQNFDFYKTGIENIDPKEIFEHFGNRPILFTFVHAHVNTDEILERFQPYWKAAYTCACCYPEMQLSKKYDVPIKEDWGIISEQRAYQVLINE